MKANYITFLSIASFLFFSCAQKEIPEEIIKPEKVLTKLNDSIYLSHQVSCIDFSNNHYYIADYKQGIYILDSSFHADTVIAAKGHGHNEVNGCGNLFIDRNDKLTFFDDNGRRFGYYQKNEMGFYARILSKRLCETRFFAKSDSIFCAILKDPNTVALIKGDEVIRTFCPQKDKIDDALHTPMSARHVIQCDSTFLVIGKGLPILQEYNYSGNLISEFNLDKIDILANNYKKQKEQDANSYIVVIRDVYYHQGHLYALATSNEPKYKCNKIIILKKTGSSFVHTNTLQLQGDIYATICINDKNELVAINGKTSAIEVYKTQIKHEQK